MNRTFDFTKEDLIKIVYFVLCKFKLDALHHQGTSSKRDLIGGFLDRWINRASEYVVFNNILKEKNFKVLPDFFLYSSDSEKNAPDILGLIDNNGDIAVRFSKYIDGAWHQEEGMPFVEVKNCRKDQLLVGVREPQMEESHYYAFVESDISEDYLTALFDEELLNESVMKSLGMNKSFIESDRGKQILEPILVGATKRIGEFRLLGIYTGSELKKFAPKYLRGQNPYYLRFIENSSLSPGLILETIGPGKIAYNYEYEHINKKGETIEPLYMPLYLDIENRIEILKKRKGVLHLKSNSKRNRIMEFRIPTGIFKLNFSEFERSSSWDEYIGYKSVFNSETNDFLAEKPEDKTEELISFFDELYNSSERKKEAC